MPRAIDKIEITLMSDGKMLVRRGPVRRFDGAWYRVRNFNKPEADRMEKCEVFYPNSWPSEEEHVDDVISHVKRRIWDMFAGATSSRRAEEKKRHG